MDKTARKGAVLGLLGPKRAYRPAAFSPEVWKVLRFSALLLLVCYSFVTRLLLIVTHCYLYFLLFGLSPPLRLPPGLGRVNPGFR